ncbi:hypothetical protein DVH24_017133 [Malus domestica]|uniref:Uncharacterized protein n=1 Tax=Malus domestica TaxID=3750 RepID=A0A498IS45_MALDO|nr:hypothetical protein DVH24_017133 [Malus domestica]
MEKIIMLGRDGTGRNGEGTKMPSDGNKEEEERDREMWNESFHEDEAEQKFTQNSSRGTARSTRFRRTKRRTERLVPLHSIPFHVPRTKRSKSKPNN